MLSWIGFIIAAGAGLWLSTVFIFPEDVLNIKLADMTIGGILRILGGIVVIPLVGSIGGSIGLWGDWAVNDFKTGKSARIEEYGNVGSDKYNAHIAKAESEAKYGRKE